MSKFETFWSIVVIASMVFIGNGVYNNEVRKKENSMLANAIVKANLEADEYNLKMHSKFRYKPASEYERVKIIGDIWNIKGEKSEYQALNFLK